MMSTLDLARVEFVERIERRTNYSDQSYTYINNLIYLCESRNGFYVKTEEQCKYCEELLYVSFYEIMMHLTSAKHISAKYGVDFYDVIEAYAAVKLLNAIKQ